MQEAFCDISRLWQNVTPCLRQESPEVSSVAAIYLQQLANWGAKGLRNVGNHLSSLSKLSNFEHYRNLGLYFMVF